MEAQPKGYGMVGLFSHTPRIKAPLGSSDHSKAEVESEFPKTGLKTHRSQRKKCFIHALANHIEFLLQIVNEFMETPIDHFIH